MYKKIFILCSLYLALFNNIYGTETPIFQELSEEFKLDEIVSELKKYSSDIDIQEISDSLISGERIEYRNFGEKIVEALKAGVTDNVRKVIFILIFLVLIGIIKSLELEENSSITKMANLVSVTVIISTFIYIFADVIKLLKDVVSIETGVVQIVSPFMMGILILSGAITTSSIIEPIILFEVSVMGLVINYIICPLLTISIVFSIISNISETVKLNKFSKFANKTALWLNGIFLAIFLGVVGVQTTVSTSVDNITIKTTQAAVSSAIPVVRQICIR